MQLNKQESNQGRASSKSVIDVGDVRENRVAEAGSRVKDETWNPNSIQSKSFR